MINNLKFKFTWEETIEILRNDPVHKELIFNSYLDENNEYNCERFFQSLEFKAVQRIIEKKTFGRNILDLAAGNGIATYAFAKLGFNVSSVEPNQSQSVGRGAINEMLSKSGLKAEVIDAYGENLPFPSNTFDIVYVRQGLHHASNLNRMLLEISRVLRPSGMLLACREHVIDNYNISLNSFLDSQIDHQFYGGEYAYTLKDYRKAITNSELLIIKEYKPFESIINIYPSSIEHINNKILQSYQGKILTQIFGANKTIAIGKWYLNRKSNPGRLYTFIAVKKN